jgi:hypothetical protein
MVLHQPDGFCGAVPQDLMADPLVLDEALGACRETCSPYGPSFRAEAHCRSVLEQLRASPETADLLGHMRLAAHEGDPEGLAQALDAFHRLVARLCRDEVLQIIAGEIPAEGVLPVFDAAEW